MEGCVMAVGGGRPWFQDSGEDHGQTGKHRQERPTKIGIQLEIDGGSRRRQTRVSSDCGVHMDVRTDSTNCRTI